MIYKLQNGGIVKLQQERQYKHGGILKAQNGTTINTPKVAQSLGRPVEVMWDPEKQLQENLDEPITPFGRSLTSFLKRYNKELSDWRKTWEKLKENLKSTERAKVIGVWEMAYGKPARVVKDGGNLS